MPAPNALNQGKRRGQIARKVPLDITKAGKTGEMGGPQLIAQIAAALEYVAQTGCTKREAAQRYSLQEYYLSPSGIEAIKSRNQIANSVITRLSTVIVGDNGCRKSGAAIFAEGIKAALLRLADIAPRVGSLDKDEERSLRQCLTFFQHARAAGMLEDETQSRIQALPSELRQQIPVHVVEDDWQPSNALTVIPDPQSAVAETVDSERVG